MFSNNTRKGLKAWVRYDGNNNAVAGSLIFQKNKPKVGKWKEYQDVSLCCPSDCTCDGNFNWYIQDAYVPALDPGWITSPNHIDGQPNFNLNLVGTGGYELYFNPADINNNLTSYLNLLVGNSGLLTLTQGTNSITYAFNPLSFFNSGYDDNVYYDDVFGPSDSITVVSPAAADFNTKDCISIYIQLEVPLQTICTINTTTSNPNPYSTPGRYFSMQHGWNGTFPYNFEILSLNINGVEYASGQVLTINSAAELELGIGIDGRTYYTNTVDWINSIIPISSQLQFYDDFNTVTHPENMLFQIIILDTNQDPGTFFYYQYSNLGFQYTQSNVPMSINELDFHPLNSNEGPSNYTCTNPF